MKFKVVTCFLLSETQICVRRHDFILPRSCFADKAGVHEQQILPTCNFSFQKGPQMNINKACSCPPCSLRQTVSKQSNKYGSLTTQDVNDSIRRSIYLAGRKKICRVSRLTRVEIVTCASLLPNRSSRPPRMKLQKQVRKDHGSCRPSSFLHR